MKRIALLAAALITAATGSALAASKTVTGKVVWLMVDDGTNAGPGNGLYTGQVFILDSTTATGTTCKVEQGGTGRTYIRIPDNATGDKMRAIVMAAYLAGKDVSATVNDANKDAQGVCYTKGVRMQN
jgi:hypothetical protein